MADSRRMVFEFIAIDRVSKAMKNIGDNTGKLAGKFAAVGKTAAFGVGGAAVGGVALLGKAMIQGVKDAESYQQLLNKTAAVIKSTGGSARVSVDHVKNLAGSLESLSGVDEELIINSQNVLMTFTRIKNTKTQDTFDQATKAALNMSTALGTDLQGATIQVGKALNDPIKGITALSRVGVSFNKSQVDTIKKLEQSGHHEKAQAIILKELNKEFGGAAKAAGKGFAGSLARLQDAVGDSFRAVGQKLLPVLTKLADWFASKGWPAMVKFATTMKARLEPTIRTVSAWLSAHFVPAVRSLAQWVTTKLMPALQKLAGVVMAKVREIIQKVSSALKDNKAHYQGLFTVISKVAAFVGRNLVPVITVLAKILFTVLGKALSAIIRIIGTVIGWIGKLYRGAVTAGKIIGNVAKTMGKAFTTFKNTVQTIALTIVSKFLWLASKIVGGAAKAFGWVPGLGGKLKKAASEVERFRQNVNNEINRIKPHKKVKITIDANGMFSGQAKSIMASKAKGGPIPKLWPGASEAYDSQPAMLRVNEHVWTPEEVKAAGGHRAVERLRRAALRGEIKGYAGGGPVVSIDAQAPSRASLAKSVFAPINRGYSSMVTSLAKAMAAAWKKYAASGGSVVAAARRWLGTPYSWGGGGKFGPSYGSGTGAHTYGFDCSGLTQYAWWQGRHKDIGGSTYAQHPNSVRISGPRPGALGFPHLGHVMLASNKPGYVIQAPHTGSFVQEVKRTASDWRWPRGMYAGGPVGQLGAKAISGPASLALRKYAAMLGIFGSGIRPRGSGGPVRAGMPYLVGEYGPEIMTPRRSGHISPAGSTVQNIHVTVNVPPSADKHQIAKEISEMLTRYKRRGGKLSFQT